MPDLLSARCAQSAPPPRQPACGIKRPAAGVGLVDDVNTRTGTPGGLQLANLPADLGAALHPSAAQRGPCCRFPPPASKLSQLSSHALIVTLFIDGMPPLSLDLVTSWATMVALWRLPVGARCCTRLFCVLCAFFA